MTDERDVMGHAVLDTPQASPKHVEVLIARHPEVQANIEGRYVGIGESPFTERGRGSAATLRPTSRRGNHTRCTPARVPAR